VRISGRFCWVEFTDVRATQAALECVSCLPEGERELTRSLKARRHDHRRPPPARVAKQVRHPQQRLEKTGALSASPLGS